MQINALARRLLQLVFSLSSSSTALTRPRLERRLGVTAADLNQAIAELGRHGLLDPQRLRLTFPGLALAVASGARTQTKPRTVAAKLPRATVACAPIALFSHSEAPRAVA